MNYVSELSEIPCHWKDMYTYIFGHVEITYQ
jgi:hypothetical protein